MAYLLSDISAQNYWNQTTIVEIIVGGWVVSFFETQCISPLDMTYYYSPPLHYDYDYDYDYDYYYHYYYYYIHLTAFFPGQPG